jgi:hypothetical protein
MIVKLAGFIPKATGFIPKAIEGLGLSNLSKKLAGNPGLVSKIQNASLIPTIALGDGAVKAMDAKPGESKIKAFGKGAAQGAFAGALIGGADQLVNTLAHHGATKLIAK